MDSLRKKIDKLKPQFTKGGKFEKLQSVFEGFESFLFVSDKTTCKGSHIRDSIDLKRTMTVVIIALIPALLFGCYNTGLQHFRSVGTDPALLQAFWFGFVKLLPLIIVSYVVGLGIEFIAAQIRGHEINEGYLVTGLLIPLIMPIDVPLWMLALAVAFSVILGKEVFGGTGMNVFNPALLARAFVFFSYPAWMTGDKVWTEGLTKGMNVIDGYSGATPCRCSPRRYCQSAFIHGNVHRYYPRFGGRNLGDCNTYRSCNTPDNRNRKLEDNAERFRRGNRDGTAAERLRGK